MGIYDRGYYRDEPGQGGFGGSRAGGYRWRFLNAWSVTTWLIVINVAVFLVDAFLAKHGLPVYMQTISNVDNLPPRQDLAVGKDYFQFDQLGRPIEATVRDVDTVLYRPLKAKDNLDGPIIGWDECVVMHPIAAVGHFSTYEAFLRLGVWRLVTFQFLHDHNNILHIAFNMFALYMFGSLVEEQLGRRKFLAFYLVSGIFGGLAYLVLNLAGTVFHIELPGVLFSATTTPLVGASAGVFGVIMASAYIAPNMPVYLMFLPVALRMRWVAYGFFALAAFNLLFNSKNPGSNAGGDAAHIGGALAGAYFIRHSHLLLDFFDVFKDSRPRKNPGSSAKPRAPKPPAHVRRRKQEEAQIDAILDKVKEHGLSSLSEKEKRLLAKDTERRRGEG